MLLQIFFNDVSTPTDECAREVALKHLRALVAMLRMAKGSCEQMVVNLDGPLANLGFGPGWPLAKLRNGGDCVEESLYLKTIEDRSPLLRAIDELRGPPPETFDYRLDAASHLPGRRALALGLAYEFGGLALSLASHPFWRRRDIALEREVLSAEGEIAAVSVVARNACDREAVSWHCHGISAALSPRAADGPELWAARSALFPNLRFTPGVRGDIEKLRRGEPTFAAILDRLGGLDLAVGRWRRDGGADPSFPFDESPESSTRMHLVWFDDGTGVRRCFSRHARFTPGKGRIHFILETSPHRHALIGHVGDKVE